MAEETTTIQTKEEAMNDILEQIKKFETDFGPIRAKTVEVVAPGASAPVIGHEAGQPLSDITALPGPTEQPMAPVEKPAEKLTEQPPVKAPDIEQPMAPVEKPAEKLTEQPPVKAPDIEQPVRPEVPRKKSPKETLGQVKTSELCKELGHRAWVYLMTTKKNAKKEN